MKITPAEVIEKYMESINNTKIPKTAFYWPGDDLCQYDWQYYIHSAWVGAWNKEGREIECIKFLTNWLTEENVSKALYNYENKISPIIKL